MFMEELSEKEKSDILYVLVRVYNQISWVKYADEKIG